MGRQDQDSAADDHRFFDGVGDKQDRKFRVVPKLEQFFLHLTPRQRVKGRERLVHKQNVGFHRHATRNRDALFHAARQHVRVGILEPFQFNFGDVLHRDIVGLLFGGAFAAIQEREGDVLFDRLPRQELVEFLKHHDPVGARFANFPPLQFHRAFDGLHITGHAFQQRGFTAAGRSQQDKPVGFENLKIHPVGGGDKMFFGLVLKRDSRDVENRLDSGNGGGMPRRSSRCIVHRVSYR